MVHRPPITPTLSPPLGPLAGKGRHPAHRVGRVKGSSRAVAFLLSLASSAGASAGIVQTPECRRDLAVANKLIAGVAARDKQFVPGDLAKNCRLLQRNLDDMIKARGPMDRCMTGHDRGENVGQMDASIGDIREVLANKCGK